MLNRRQTLRGLAAAAATGLAASAVSSKDRCVAFTPDMQQAKTPAQALKRLQEGNARFVAGQALHCDLPEQVRSTAQQQAPFAAGGAAHGILRRCDTEPAAASLFFVIS
mgnify:FL=1